MHKTDAVHTPLNLKTPKIWSLMLKDLEIDRPADKTK